MGSIKENKERRMKEQARKRKIKQLQHGSMQLSLCMCYFLSRFGMHGITCGSFFVVAWVWPGVIVFSA